MLSVEAVEELRISAHSGYTRGGIERFLCVSIINAESPTLMIPPVNNTWQSWKTRDKHKPEIDK